MKALILLPLLALCSCAVSYTTTEVRRANGEVHFARNFSTGNQSDVATEAGETAMAIGGVDNTSHKVATRQIRADGEKSARKWELLNTLLKTL